MADYDGPGGGVPSILKHYRLGRRLGTGGMGSVYEAIDRRDGTEVAVKLLHPHLAADATFRERFEREAHVAALLRSPYSVHLLDYGFADGYYFLVMEYVDGESVRERIDREGPLDPRSALQIAADAARSLEEAAARGVVHRDIKPENILLGRDGSVKVSDFGIARRAGASGDLTMPGGFVGTTAYAAPEQATGDIDHRADIYALGATLYCMLTGRPPFSGPTAFDVIRQHREAALPMAPLEGLPDAVINVIRRAMEKDPADRYRDASEMAASIERALRSLSNVSTPVPAPPPASTPPPPPPPTPARAPTPAPESPPTRLVASTPPAEATPLNARAGVATRIEDEPDPTRPPGITRTAPESTTTGGGGGSRWLLIALAVLVIGGIGGAGGWWFFLREDDDGPTRGTSNGGGGGGLGGFFRPTSTPTRTPRPGTPTTTPTRTPSPTPTPTIVGGVPANSIVAGEWNYLFRTISNTCGSGAQPGEEFEVTFTLKEVGSGDGFLTAGEQVEIIDGLSGNSLGTFTFSFPNFAFTALLQGGDFLLVRNTYSTPQQGTSVREDHYTVNGRPCVITFEDG